MPFAISNRYSSLAAIGLSAVLMAASQLSAFGFLALVGYVPVLLLTTRSSVRMAFCNLWAANTLQYMETLYWLLTAMTVFGGLHFVTSLLALFLLSAFIGLYFGGAMALARYLGNRKVGSVALWFPFVLCGTEYLRDYGFIGSFPWGCSGYSLISTPRLLQSASLWGVYGLVFFVGVINSLLAVAIQKRKVSIGCLALGIIGLVALFGEYQIRTHQSKASETVRVALLQGNIEQGIKNHASVYSSQILNRYQTLQSKAAASGAQIAVWPESSYPFSVSSNHPHFESLGQLAPINIIGALSHDNERRFYNSAFILNAQNDVLARFDKVQLVPFGEYVPWPFEPIAMKLVPQLGQLEWGNRFEPLRWGNLALAATVCYDGAFPNVARQFVQNGANLLINMTNDAWYGFTEGPVQHLRMYQMRSVETGRSFARATNTGISGWIDRTGQVHDATPLYEEALVLADIPLETDETWFVRWGQWVPLLSLALILAVLLWVRRPQTGIDWIWLLIGLAIVLFSYTVLGAKTPLFHEAAKTQTSALSLIGLLVGLRVWKSTTLN